MSKIYCLPGSGDLSPITVLRMAEQNDYEELIVVGKSTDGTISVQATSGNLPKLHWWMSQAQDIILNAAS